LKKCILYIVLLSFFFFHSRAQNFPVKGVPPLTNFTPEQYLNSGKTWDIASAPNGIAYLASDKGLLEYDGQNWKIFKGSTGITRSLIVVNDSVIYTGSDIDFGIWERDNLLEFQYKSLYSLGENMPDLNEEFWDVFQLNDDIVFISFKNIYALRGEQLVKIAAPENFAGGWKVNDEIYLADSRQGIFRFENYSLLKLYDPPNEDPFELIGIYSDSLGKVVVTKDSGLFRFGENSLEPFDNEISKILKVSKAFSFEAIGDSQLAFGTVLKGLFITDLQGRIIHQLNRNKGLPSNTILSLHHSDYNQIWIGMDYGISSLALRDNTSSILDYGGSFGNSFTAHIYGENFYLGTNQGLYWSKWAGLDNSLESFNFNLIPESEGQVWTLDVVDSQLLMGHDKGLFYVNNNLIEKIANQDGVWNLVPYQNNLLAGNYNGISIFQKAGNIWKFDRKMNFIYGSCNQLFIEGSNILWVNIPNYGIIRAELDDDLEPINRSIFEFVFFDAAETFLSVGDDGVKVVTILAEYLFDQTEGKFKRNPLERNIADISNSNPGLSKNLNSDYEFLPNYNGFDLKFLKPSNSVEIKNYNLQIRRIEAFGNDSIMTLGQLKEVPYAINNLRIKAIVPNQKGVLYQFKLNDDEWGILSADTDVEFWNVKAGENSVFVRALVDGQLTEELEIPLYVVAPWYLTSWAYFIYLVVLCLIIFLIYAWFQKSLVNQERVLKQKEQQYLREQAEKHKQELIILEQKQLQSQYEQLEEQLKNKTIDLAVKARENEEKNRLIVKIKEIFEFAQSNPSKLTFKLGEVKRLLDTYLTDESKTFEIQMDELHQEFFKKLKEQFPSLSNNDLRWCAYLKIGLNSKEIAEILNILPSSSYISRSRLRKKLNLKAEEDLFDFLNSI